MKDELGVSVVSMGHDFFGVLGLPKHTWPSFVLDTIPKIIPKRFFIGCVSIHH